MGTRLPEHIVRRDGSRYDSGTQFEFEDAVEGRAERVGQGEAPTPDLLVYRKTAEPTASLRNRAELERRFEQFERLSRFLDGWFLNPTDGSLAKAFHPFAEPAEFERLLERHLRSLLEARLPAARIDVDTVDRIAWDTSVRGSPFRGLSHFQFEHAPIFFGRTKATTEIVEAMRRHARNGRPFQNRVTTMVSSARVELWRRTTPARTRRFLASAATAAAW